MTDSFDSFVNFDWFSAENDTLKQQEELDLESMTSSDLFKYFLESEIAKNYNANPAQFDYTLFTPDSTALDLIANPVTTGPNTTTHSLAHQNQLAVNFSLPDSPVSSHHSDEDVSMAEVKTEPLMFNPTELLRMDGELDSKTLVSAAVAALFAQQPQQQQQQQQQSAKSTPQQNTKQTSRSRRASSFDSDDEPMPTDAAELKKMTSKERRQMRNKISARNFRVRRKEYISTLEAQVQQHQNEAQQLRDQMSVMEEENKKLRDEVEQLRRQSTLETTLAAKPSARAPITKPNYNKDLSISGSRATDTYRNDSHTLVSSAIMPEWNFDQILARSAAPKPADAAPKTATPVTGSSLLADMAFTAAHPREAALATAFVACLGQRLIAYFTESLTQMSVEEAVRRLFPASTEPVPVPAPTHVKPDWDMPLKPDELSFSPKPAPEELPPSPAPESDPAVPSAAYMEWLYDAIIMAALSPRQAAHESEEAVSSLDRLASFFWWDEASSV
ncbi:hypothetical protein BC937DRAFT_90033 [Endogone sp. FLAS-F59071]|nr:hypothetical protein BC937DRAFT_90033 [Endogone sp. FLAS-F59071]|eukprot:RUS22202.1 hypothetical protein BC937DRAFT_90033 [Endogone sp. FLAS-F59071]